MDRVGGVRRQVVSVKAIVLKPNVHVPHGKLQVGHRL